jgi:hypothetical protein
MKKTRDLLIRHFNVDDLRDLCFRMSIYADQFPQTLHAFTRELVLYIDRNELWDKLLVVAAEMRPKVDWSYLENYQNRSIPAPIEPGDVAAPSGRNFREHAAILIDLLTIMPGWEEESNRYSFLMLNGMEGFEQGVELEGSRRDAAVNLLAAILRFQGSDPQFVAETCANLYTALAATGLFSYAKRREFVAEAAALRNLFKNGN